MSFDPIAILRTLAAYKVDFVLIGGYAAVALGAPLATVDLDICYRRTDDNLERLAEALREMNARLRGVDVEVPFLLDAKTIAAGDHFTLTTDLGDLDLLGTPSGTAGYEELDPDAISIDLNGLRIRVSSPEKLIRMKKAAGRPKDLFHLETLGALQEELERRKND